MSVQLKVDNGVRSSGVFLLYELVNNQWVKKESDRHSVFTGDDGCVVFKLNEPPSSMENESLAWTINSCSQVPGVEKATLRVEFWQDDVKCTTSASTVYNRTYPQCSTNQQRTQGSAVVFKNVVQSPSSTRTLWKNMSV